MTKNAQTIQPMRKENLVDSVAELSGLSRAASTRALDAMIRFITKSLKDGNDIKISDFGTFLVTKRNQRLGRNPRTGDTINVPAKNISKFRPSKKLKDAIA